MGQIVKGLMGILAALLLSSCATQGPMEGWTTLLDGERGLENWNRTGAGNWRAADGAIVIDAKTSKEAAFLVSKNSYTDFELYVEFSADEEANSGVFLRVTKPQEINTQSSYEVQIFDKNAKFPTASFVNLVRAPDSFKAAGRWNAFYIHAKGPRMSVKMNGELAAEVNHSAFPSGPIGLQYNTGTLRFRKVLIRPL